jgi:hypothetical protein
MTMRAVVPLILMVMSLAAGCAPRPPDIVTESGEAGNIVITNDETGRSIRIPVPAHNGKPTDVKGVEELTDVFVRMCLQTFPDDDAVAAKAQAEGYAPLTAAQVSFFLHSDPGRAWDVRFKDQVMALTIELPPFHACGVRAILPTDADVGWSTAIPVGLWAASRPTPETVAVLPLRTITTNGVMQDFQVFMLSGPDKKFIESIGAYITHYADSPRVELRLVRMRGNTPH